MGSIIPVVFIIFIKKQYIMYLLHGKMKAKAGKSDELVSILLQASTFLSTAQGCKLYVVGKNEQEIDSIYVTEIWDSKEDHNQSLLIQGVRELITRAMPILDGPPAKGQELELLGGIGI